jgi:hypothetical protein
MRYDDSEAVMTIRPEKLETIILTSLRPYSEGKRDESITGWGNSLLSALGERPDSAEIVGAMIRLRNRGLVRLLKFVPAENAWYNYAADEQIDDSWFFYHATFIVAITDEGRGVMAVSSNPIGFQQPA